MSNQDANTKAWNCYLAHQICCIRILSNNRIPFLRAAERGFAVTKSVKGKDLSETRNKYRINDLIDPCYPPGSAPRFSSPGVDAHPTK